MIEKSMEVFMDNFSAFGETFDCCLKMIGTILKIYIETNLILN